MNYEIFISYEISDSSLAYELVATLGRNNMTYYLDCVNSSVTMSGYVKGIFEGCRAFVPLMSTRYLSEGYARELLSCAVGTNKQVLPCFTDDCVLPDEFASFIPDGNRIDIRGGAGTVAWDEISRLLLAQGEEKDSTEYRDESSQPTIENVPELEPDIEVPVGQVTNIDEEKKRAIANLLYVLRAYKEEETGRIRCYKPEPSKTMILDENEKEKTLQQRVWDVIFFPFRFVFALFIMALFKAPLLTILVVILVAVKCCNDEPKVSPPVRQEFTTEQVACHGGYTLSAVPECQALRPDKTKGILG